MLLIYPDLHWRRRTCWRGRSWCWSKRRRSTVDSLSHQRYLLSFVTLILRMLKVFDDTFELITNNVLYYVAMHQWSCELLVLYVGTLHRHHSNIAYMTDTDTSKLHWMAENINVTAQGTKVAMKPICGQSQISKYQSSIQRDSMKFIFSHFTL